MYSQYQAAGYNITKDPRFQNKEFGIDESLLLILNKLFMECQQKNNKKTIPRLKELITKYPSNPQLKNFLSAAYSSNGEYAKSDETTKQILDLHPNYLFGKINQAYKYIYDGMFEKVPGILGESMELKALYPDRDLFHLTEVTGFYKVAVFYYAALGNIDAAEKKLTVLQSCAPDHFDTKAAEDVMFRERMKMKFNKWTDEKKARIVVKCSMPIPVSKQQTPPGFHHAEIIDLYMHGIKIPADKLHAILALPRESVIADLEKILTDAVDRYQYFKGLVYDENERVFPIHALILLGELKSENSLPVILKFLENDNEVLDFWLGDHLTSTVWLPVYLLSQNTLAILKSFLLKPGVDSLSKALVADALVQIVLHHPEKTNEVSAIFKEVFTAFSLAGINDNLIDSDFLALTVASAMDAGLVELLPSIKELYDKKYVNLDVNGDFKEVEAFFKKSTTPDLKKDIESIFELYQRILSTWHSVTANEADEFEDSFINPAPPIKTGRNDPCPCGSGKKFKKCCIDKSPY